MSSLLQTVSGRRLESLSLGMWISLRVVAMPFGEHGKNFKLLREMHRQLTVASKGFLMET
jgi:hypothetical protein